MAFPVIESTAVYNGTSAIQNHSVTLPAGIVSGDLLLIILAGHDELFGLPPGWTSKESRLNAIVAGEQAASRVIARIADGTEGSTVTVSYPTLLRKLIAVAYRISNWGGNLSTSIGVAHTFTHSASVDPPNVTAGWGSDDNLFLANICAANDGTAIGDIPANYTNLLGANGAGTNESQTLGSVRRFLAAASDNPGIFTTPGNGESVIGITIVIQPAGAPATVTGDAVAEIHHSETVAAGQASIVGSSISAVHHIENTAVGQFINTGTALSEVHHTETEAAGTALAAEVTGTATSEVHHTENVVAGESDILGDAINEVHHTEIEAAGTSDVENNALNSIHHIEVTASGESITSTTKDIHAAVIHANAPTSVGSQIISNIGFTPKACIVIAQHAEIADEVTASNVSLSIGFATADAQWTNSIHVVGGSNPVSAKKYQADDAIIFAGDDVAVTLEASSLNILENAWEFNWTTVPSVAFPITYIFFGGNDLEAFVGNAPVENTISTYSAGTVDPEILFTTSIGSATNPAGGIGPENNASISFGIALKEANQVVHQWNISDGETGVTTHYIDRSLIAGEISSSAFVWAAAVQNQQVGSFDLDPVGTTPNLDFIGYLALNISGANVALAGKDSPNSTELVWTFLPGFRPQLGLALFNFSTTESKTFQSDAAVYGIGAFDALIASSEAVESDTDAAAPHAAAGWHSNKFIYFGDPIEYAIDRPSILNNGWLKLASTADTSTHKWTVFALQDSIGTSGSIVSEIHQIEVVAAGTVSEAAAVTGTALAAVHHIENTIAGDFVNTGTVTSDIHHVENNIIGELETAGAATSEIHHITQTAIGESSIVGIIITAVHNIENEIIGELESTGTALAEVHHIENESIGLSGQEILGIGLAEVHHIENSAIGKLIITGDIVAEVHHVENEAAATSAITGSILAAIHRVEIDAIGTATITGDAICEIHHIDMVSGEGECTPSEDDLFIYPLSSPQGRRIPTEVLGPLWYINKSFTTSPLPSILTLPLLSFVAELYTDADCLVSFCTTPIIIPGDFVAKPFTYLLRADQTRVIEVIDRNKFSVVGLTTSGTLHMNIIKKYAAMALENMVFRT